MREDDDDDVGSGSWNLTPHLQSFLSQLNNFTLNLKYSHNIIIIHKATIVPVDGKIFVIWRKKLYGIMSPQFWEMRYNISLGDESKGDWR